VVVLFQENIVAIALEGIHDGAQVRIVTVDGYNIGWQAWYQFVGAGQFLVPQANLAIRQEIPFGQLAGFLGRAEGMQGYHSSGSAPQEAVHTVVDQDGRFPSLEVFSLDHLGLQLIDLGQRVNVTGILGHLLRQRSQILGHQAHKLIGYALLEQQGGHGSLGKWILQGF